MLGNGGTRDWVFYRWSKHQSNHPKLTSLQPYSITNIAKIGASLPPPQTTSTFSRHFISAATTTAITTTATTFVTTVHCAFAVAFTVTTTVFITTSAVTASPYNFNCKH